MLVHCYVYMILADKQAGLIPFTVVRSSLGIRFVPGFIQNSSDATGVSNPQ